MLVGAFFFFGAPEPDLSPLIGTPRIVDGDTVAFDDRVVRIVGIDAPEFDQVCQYEGGHVWPCGEHSSQFLQQLARSYTWRCDHSGTDKYRRILARCWLLTRGAQSQTNGADVASRLVAAGLAFSEAGYGQEEALAKASRLGMHAGDYIRPIDWRNGKRFDEENGQNRNLLQWIWQGVVSWF